MNIINDEQKQDSEPDMNPSQVSSLDKCGPECPPSCIYDYDDYENNNCEQKKPCYPCFWIASFLTHNHKYFGVVYDNDIKSTDNACVLFESVNIDTMPGGSIMKTTITSRLFVKDIAYEAVHGRSQNLPCTCGSDHYEGSSYCDDTYGCTHCARCCKVSITLTHIINFIEDIRKYAFYAGLEYCYDNYICRKKLIDMVYCDNCDMFVFDCKEPKQPHPCIGQNPLKPFIWKY